MTDKQAVTKPPTAAQTKALVKAGDERWTKGTEDLRQRRKDMSGEILQYHYDVGLFACSVIEDKDKDPKKRLYGSHVVSELGGSINMSNSVVHSCIKFARRIDLDELERLKTAEYPWRSVASLITVDNAKTYAELKEKYEQGEFKNSDELKGGVKEANDKAREGDKTKDQRGGHSNAASQVKSLNTMLNQATAKVIPDFMKAVTTFVKKGDTMSEATVEAIKAGAKEAHRNIRSAQTLLDKADKVIKDSGI